MKDKAERVMECERRHPDWPERRIANSIGCTIPFVKWTLRHDAEPRKEVSLVSLEEIAEAYDILGHIKSTISELPGGKLIEEEELVRKSCPGRIGMFRDMLFSCSEIGQYRVKLRLGKNPPTWYWGKAEDITRAKAMIEPWMIKD